MVDERQVRRGADEVPRKGRARGREVAAAHVVADVVDAVGADDGQHCGCGQEGQDGAAGLHTKPCLLDTTSRGLWSITDSIQSQTEVYEMHWLDFIHALPCSCRSCEVHNTHIKMLQKHDSALRPIFGHCTYF